MRKRLLTIAIALLGTMLVVPLASAQDRTEADGCANCHFSPGTELQLFIDDGWRPSDHANSDHGFNLNTYCARCHSPFQADPAATRHDRDPVPLDEWEAVTCSACHMTRQLRTESGTPIGFYDIDAGEFSPVYEEEANDLCLHCHTNGHAEQMFQGYGKAMNKKGVLCMDCHMPKVPNEYDPDGKLRHSHTWKVRENAEYSCLAAGCHDNKKLEWALKQIDKEKIHGVRQH